MVNGRVKAKLDMIDAALKQYDETIYSDSSEHEVENYRKWCLENCNGLILTEDYVEIVSAIDGFDFNGLSLYTLNSDDENSVYESNEIYWDNENLRKYLFLGEDSISWYGISIDSGEYYILDKPSGSIIEKYSNFEELLLVALESVL